MPCDSPSDTTEHPRLGAHQLRHLSYLAQVDPRTFAKALRGDRVSTMPAERIRRALREAGLEHLLSKSSSAPHSSSTVGE